MTHPTIPDRVPAGATPEGDGVVVGPGPVRIDAFIDFLCPFCKRFELSSGPTLAGLVADGLASLVYHPMNFLDAASTTQLLDPCGRVVRLRRRLGPVPRVRACAVRQPAARGRSRADRRRTRRHRPRRRARHGVHRVFVRRTVPGLAALCHRARRRGWRQRYADRTGQQRNGHAGGTSDLRRCRPGRACAMTAASPAASSTVGDYVSQASPLQALSPESVRAMPRWTASMR